MSQKEFVFLKRLHSGS